MSSDARNALSQAIDGAKLIASSKEINDGDGDPPCTRAEREYKKIAKDADGEFFCVMTETSAKEPQPLEFELTDTGPSRVAQTKKADRAYATVITQPSKPWAP